MSDKKSRRSRFTVVVGGAAAVALGAMLFSTGPAVAAPEAPTTSPVIGAVDTNAAPLIVRSTPYDEAENLGQMVSQTKVVLKCKIDDGKEIVRDGEKSRTWYKLDTSRSDGRPEVPGWIAGIYTKVADDANVPQCSTASTKQSVPDGALDDAVGG
ncbi:hypothetical protein [Streptomyces sp. NPDC059009]|uniref:hypothetical protein n=1 Tax=Streptomyces sp. NPDC059009 TaxID=3346694 RepID=UPI0036B13DE2